jgi:hypothetical protein
MAGSDEDFLSRWSRRKRADRAGSPVEEAKPVAQAVPASGAAGTAPGEAATPPEPLPTVESLTPESDFTPFMEKEVDPGLRREALKKLFSDPRYNVMDRLDTYIDDYSIPDPMPEEWLGKLSAMAGLGDVPGRQKAEREARELAEREAVGASGEGPGENEGREAAPPAAEAARPEADSAELRDETRPAPAPPPIAP